MKNILNFKENSFLSYLSHTSLHQTQPGTNSEMLCLWSHSDIYRCLNREPTDSGSKMKTGDMQSHINQRVIVALRDFFGK